MILFIDNYDSFTYNLVDLIGRFEPAVEVVRNDQICLEDIRQMDPDGIVLSPGPGTPEEAGICTETIREFYREVPILGVCLGHQCIGQVFGARIVRAGQPVHGKTAPIMHDQKDLFERLPLPFTATRYHSLIIERASLPPELDITAWTEDEIIMAIRHVYYPLSGVQFHPESILTPQGPALIKNWLKEVHQHRSDLKRSVAM